VQVPKRKSVRISPMAVSDLFEAEMLDEADRACLGGPPNVNAASWCCASSISLGGGLLGPAGDSALDASGRLVLPTGGTELPAVIVSGTCSAAQ
jgi:hypothetical protein